MSDFRAERIIRHKKNRLSIAASRGDREPKAKSAERKGALHLFRLVVVLHSAVLVVLPRDVVIGIDVAGFSDALRFICSDRRACGMLWSRNIRPAAARFFASALFFVRTFFMPTFFAHRVVRTVVHTVVHTMTFSSTRLGIQTHLWRDQRSAALVPHRHGVN